jgi:hypothetical protein
MREGTNSMVMVADRPYGEFYGFYSVSPEYFEYPVVYADRWTGSHDESFFAVCANLPKYAV